MKDLTKVPQKRGGAKLGAGRPKGSQNKTTTKIKEAILEAFEKKGGVKFLIKLAEDDPKTFALLLAKILPQEMVAELNEKKTNYVFHMVKQVNE